MRWSLHLLAALLAVAPGGAHAQLSDFVPSEEDAVYDAPPHDALPDAALTGRHIYERVIANRFESYMERRRILSSDAAGNEKQTMLWARWKDGRDASGKIKGGIVSRTLIKYREPEDVRGAGYLVIQKSAPPHDQFVYLPSRRKVTRVNVSEPVLGTDLAVEDIVPRDLESSDYSRAPDELLGETPCFVVELTPRPSADSGYSKLLIYVTKEHSVSLRTRYWDLNGIEVKEFNAPVSSLERIRGVWIVREGTMRNLIDDTKTTVYVEEIDPDAAFRNSVFSVRNLERGSR